MARKAVSTMSAYPPHAGSPPTPVIPGRFGAGRERTVRIGIVAAESSPTALDPLRTSRSTIGL
jgi:hypothetical protein